MEQNKTQHSAGPWFTYGNGQEVGSFAGTGSAVADCEMKMRTKAECEANARLIASAPDLLEACQDAESILWMAERYAEGGGSHSIEMEDYTAAAEQIRAAIARATGEAL